MCLILVVCFPRFMPLFLNNSSPKCMKVYFLRPPYLNFFRAQQRSTGSVVYFLFRILVFFMSLTLVKIICV